MGDKKKDKIDSLGLDEVADDIKSAAGTIAGIASASAKVAVDMVKKTATSATETAGKIASQSATTAADFTDETTGTKIGSKTKAGVETAIGMGVSASGTAVEAASSAVSVGGSVIEAVGEAAKATAEQGKKAGAGLREKGDEFIDNVSKEIKKKDKD